MTDKNSEIHASCVLLFNCTDEEVLSIQKQADPHKSYGLPGGKAEEGENPLQTALRELMEETGVSLSNEQISDDCFICPGNSGKDVMTIVAMTCKKVELKSSQEGSVQWALPEKLCEGTFAEYNKELFSMFSRKDAPKPICNCKP